MNNFAIPISGHSVQYSIASQSEYETKFSHVEVTNTGGGRKIKTALAVW